MLGKHARQHADSSSGRGRGSRYCSSFFFDYSCITLSSLWLWYNSISHRMLIGTSRVCAFTSLASSLSSSRRVVSFSLFRLQHQPRFLSNTNNTNNNNNRPFLSTNKTIMSQQQQQQKPPSSNQEQGREITTTQEDIDRKQEELDAELQEVSVCLFSHLYKNTKSTVPSLYFGASVATCFAL